jgi:hypothetical protein
MEKPEIEPMTKGEKYFIVFIIIIIIVFTILAFTSSTGSWH